MSLPMPIRDRVLVRRSNPEDTTPGGLIIPDSVKEKPGEGEVLEVGTGLVVMDGTSVPLAVHRGDKVLFQKGTGVELKHEGEELLLLREADILCVLDRAQR